MSLLEESTYVPVTIGGSIVLRDADCAAIYRLCPANFAWVLVDIATKTIYTCRRLVRRSRTIPCTSQSLDDNQDDLDQDDDFAQADHSDTIQPLYA